MEDIMQHFNLTIIASLEPDMPWSRDRLDTLKADMMERMMTMESYGGINLRVERRRGLVKGRRNKYLTCWSKSQLCLFI